MHADWFRAEIERRLLLFKCWSFDCVLGVITGHDTVRLNKHERTTVEVCVTAASGTFSPEF